MSEYGRRGEGVCSKEFRDTLTRGDAFSRFVNSKNTVFRVTSRFRRNRHGLKFYYAPMNMHAEAQREIREKQVRVSEI